MSKSLKEIPVIVLCGGLGTRIQAVLKNRPKVLAPIGGSTLLDIIIGMFIKTGFEKIILSVGYLKEHIKEHIEKNNYRVILSEEEEPLGTGGALKKALDYVGDARHFFVMNGDTVYRPNFALLRTFHERRNALMSMALTRRYVGSGGNVVIIDETKRVIGWRLKTEKDQPEELPLNAGTYLFDSAVSKLLPKKQKFSLENDLFPTLWQHNCFGFETDDIFIDIGVPERYKMANEMFENGLIKNYV